LLFKENACIIHTTFVFYKIFRKLSRWRFLNFTHSRPVSELVKTAISFAQK